MVLSTILNVVLCLSASVVTYYLLCGLHSRHFFSEEACFLLKYRGEGKEAALGAVSQRRGLEGEQHNERLARPYNQLRRAPFMQLVPLALAGILASYSLISGSGMLKGATRLLSRKYMSAR